MAEEWAVCVYLMAHHPLSTILSVCNLLSSFFRNDVASGSRWALLIFTNFAGLWCCYFVELFLRKPALREKLSFLIVLIACNASYLRSFPVSPFVKLIGSIACLVILSIECGILADDAGQPPFPDRL
ncbi:hypothetical protein HPP92_005079 [Vanilla planifolia]|uniref:Uncharacterized protein n=1 Tax=Vanilla planifolia TaxID=51239 RepID=A0A835RTD0_VANPL|nr:hypothetical protein HPP92_005079 [Vanilla planifolia]